MKERILIKWIAGATLACGVFAGSLTCTSLPAQAAEKITGDNLNDTVFVQIMPSSFLLSPIHEKNYITLLAKQYAPDSIEDWNKAFDRRASVEKKNKPINTAQAQTVTITTNSSSVENSKPSDNDNIIATTMAKSVAVTPADDKAIELFTAFEKAVAENDAAAIKALLPQLLTDYNKMTDILEKSTD